MEIYESEYFYERDGQKIGRVKDWLSESEREKSPHFVKDMDRYLGKKLMFVRIDNSPWYKGYIEATVGGNTEWINTGFNFIVDWLEPLVCWQMPDISISFSSFT